MAGKKSEKNPRKYTYPEKHQLTLYLDTKYFKKIKADAKENCGSTVQVIRKIVRDYYDNQSK